MQLLCVRDQKRGIAYGNMREKNIRPAEGGQDIDRRKSTGRILAILNFVKIKLSKIIDENGKIVVV